MHVDFRAMRSESHGGKMFRFPHFNVRRGGSVRSVEVLYQTEGFFAGRPAPYHTAPDRAASCSSAPYPRKKRSARRWIASLLESVLLWNGLIRAECATNVVLASRGYYSSATPSHNPPHQHRYVIEPCGGFAVIPVLLTSVDHRP